MAKVTIENAKVARIIEGYGFVVSSEYKTRAGETANEYFTVWSAHPVKVGDTVSIAGRLSTKLGEYNGKQRVEVHVNDAKVQADTPF